MDLKISRVVGEEAYNIFSKGCIKLQMLKNTNLQNGQLCIL